jgi:hypothetical protein
LRSREWAIQDVQELTTLVDLYVHDGHSVQRACVVGLSARGGIKGGCVEHGCRLTVYLTEVNDVGRKGAYIRIFVV